MVLEAIRVLGALLGVPFYLEDPPAGRIGINLVFVGLVAVLYSLITWAMRTERLRLESPAENLLKELGMDGPFRLQTVPAAIETEPS